MTRRLYDAKHVQIVDRGLTITALWIPDPEAARSPAYVLDHICDPQFASVEVVAQAIRCYKRDGASFSGWIVRSGLDHGDPIPNKREAMQSLRHSVAAYFTR